MPTDRPTLAVVPLHLRDVDELDVAVRSLVSLRCSAPEAALLVIDDASPFGAGVSDLEAALGEIGGEMVRLDRRVGTPAALNVGLAGARDYGFDAVLVDSGVEFRAADWLERLAARQDAHGRPAALVGGRLLDARGLLWHAGLYHSLLRLEWFHRFQWGPGDLPEALHPCRCPVGTELALVRHETILAAGLLDERLGRLAAVDYSLRVYAAGLEVLYEPTACAVQLRPGRDTLETRTPEEVVAADRLMAGRWPTPDLTPWIPDPL